ncbi:MAG: enoyl-ACP reductase [Dehalococcoidia bacterium]|nr:enoyl-ACP reductase [Dehalococcoidia bacterium]MDW8120194.1 enoyl-ACP reductase [Chloroflexota bacterium]
MFTIDLSGKTAAVFGVANEWSIAWHIAQALDGAGARLAIAYQNERLRERVERLAPTLRQTPLLLQCDVQNEGEVASAFARLAEAFGTLHMLVHSIAYAQREDISGSFLKTGREGFRIALEVSAYSFLLLVREAVPLMRQGGSILTLTFQASQRVFPGYNIMGTAKAALEHEVRQLAYELGPHNIRVNALSAGPLDTLAARGIAGFVDMKHIHAQRSPLKRNITHQEVGKAALFLLSDWASGITGVILPVDAGYHIMGL